MLKTQKSVLFIVCLIQNNIVILQYLMGSDIIDKNRTVVHLQIGDEHYYYGSIKSLCEHNDYEKIGVTYNTLRCYGLSSDKPYFNKKCTIRKGLLIPQKGNRGAKHLD